MTGPLHADEPLAHPSGPQRPRRPPPAPPPRRRKPNWFIRFTRGVFGAFLGLAMLGGSCAAVVGYLAWQHYSANLPDVDGLKNYQPPVMSRVFASNGQLVTDLAAERRIYVPLSEIPSTVTSAFLAAEDKDFWVHGGIDPLAIVRAGIYDLMHLGSGRRPLGASTITQQVAKNMLLDSNQVTLARKIREAILAMRMQEVMSKQRILELYLNEIYLGMDSYGVAAAAQAYFNKGLDQLTLAEAAFLGGLPKGPNNYNPFKHPDAAKIRRDWVLDRMADDGFITRAQAKAAQQQPIVPTEFHHPAPVPGAEWFTEEVRQELLQKFGPEETTEGGLQVRTTLDPRLQDVAEKSVRDGLMAYDRKLGGWRGPVTHLDLGLAAVSLMKADQGKGSDDWATALAKVTPPAGMLRDWRLGVVLSESDSAARLGWLEPAPGINQPPIPRTGVIALADIAWARPVQDGKPGPAPRKIADVMQPGDVVMVQPADSAAAGVSQAPVHLTLRQIPQVQAALVSLDPTTGRVVAMVGGWSYDQSQFNRATMAERQPGSSFKPFVYLTALERGLSPSQRFLDAPIVVNTPNGEWRPGNYERNFGGPTSLQVALEQSLNLVTLRLARWIGMGPIANTAIAFHEVTSMPQVLPAALGAVSTTVLQEAGAYASLDEGGRLVTPTLIDSVQDQDGQVVWRPAGLTCECSNPDAPPQIVDNRPVVADPQSDYQLLTMMQGVVQRGTGVPVAKDLGRPIAGKTGTSEDFNDAWFAGFTPDLVTVVWAGFDTPRSLGNNETGAAVAGPIWHDYMAQALKGRPVLQFPQPPGLVMASWQSRDGTVTDAFKPDQVPGASQPLDMGMGVASESAVPGTTPAAAPGGASGAGNGMDTSLGGLY
ncbi:MAG TPA: PBP1A family penicillin-binding protein [Acetobacteraceae bacterium]|nr:PBP1A family penicillin-binding protein [Acetobacteraceae bacterium]